MAIPKSGNIPNLHRLSIIYVDSYEKKCIAGRFYHPILGRAKVFHSLIELLKMMEELFDDMEYPMANMRMRKFQPETFRIEQEAYGKKENVSMHYLEPKGKLVTFSVNVQFRMNASWQGSLRWTDKNKEECFRSTLEMIMLMDNALGEGEG